MYRTTVGLAAGIALAMAASSALAQPASPAPTSGIGPYVTGLLEKACMPMIKGQDPKVVAKAAGLKRSGDDWALQLPGVQKIVLSGPTAANPTVCSMSVNYDLGQTNALVDTLTAWAAAQTPPLPPRSVAYTGAPGMTGWSWSLDDGTIQEGLVFNAQRLSDGKPAGKNYDVGTVLFSRRGP
jgi:hypothetical protein